MDIEMLLDYMMTLRDCQTNECIQQVKQRNARLGIEAKLPPYNGLGRWTEAHGESVFVQGTDLMEVDKTLESELRSCMDAIEKSYADHRKFAASTCLRQMQALATAIGYQLPAHNIGAQQP